MPRIVLPNAGEKDVKVMEALLADGHIEQKYAVRVQAVVSRAKGIPTNTVAAVLGININGVSTHVNRYNAGGLDALLKDKTRKPGTPPIPAETVNEIIRTACQEKPKNATHWSTRSLAAKFKVSHTAVNTILRRHNVKPHLVKRFKFSTDAHFAQKLEDVVGLYLNPPENSIVFCVDEKSQIQALQRTDPILPVREGLPERQTHDYERHGTTTLFAALNVASGRVTGKLSHTHKAADYVEFLKVLDRETPRDKTLHVIADNYSSHKAPPVAEYVRTRPGRFVEHFIPTYSSWLNMVERWFAEITNKRIRRGSFNSLKELEKAITDYIVTWNESGKCFRWTKTYENIQKSIEKAKN